MARLIGIDIAHPVAGHGKRAAKDHRHRLRTVRPFDYTEAAAPLAAFWKEVNRWCGKKESGHEDAEGRNRLLLGHEGTHDGDR